MRRYTVNVNGTDHLVEIDGDLVSVNGKTISASLVRVEEGETTSAAPAAAAAAAPAAGGPTASSDVTAPMPGVILEVTAKVGDNVQRGDTIAILEAMKMRNELRATSAGRVASIDVKAGDSVVFGQQIAHLEG